MVQLENRDTESPLDSVGHRRFWRTALALAAGFAAVSVLSNVVEKRLDLTPGTPGMLAYDLALAIGMTLVGALVLRRALRPIVGELRHRQIKLDRIQGELESVIAAAPIAIITLDEAGNVTEVWNPAAERMFGWSQAEVQGRPAPFVAPDKQAEFAAHRDRTLAGNLLPGVEVVRIRRDGSPIHLRLHTALIPPDDTRPRGIVALIVDETQQVRDRENLAFQGAIIAQLDDPVIAYDERFEVTYWNAAAERLYGWTAAEMMGTYANTRLDMQPIGTTLEGIRDELQRHGIFHGELLQRRKDGSRVRVEARSAVLRDVLGRPRGFITSNRDLTAREQMQSSLRESEERYQRLGENVPDVIFRYRLTDPPGYEYVSSAIFKMSGYTPEDFYHHPDVPLASTHPEDLPRLLEMVADPTTLTGRPEVIRFARKDGTPYWTENRHTAVRNKSGQIVAIEWVARDITDRVTAEAALRESEERYRRLAENAPDVIYRYRVRPDRGFEYVSPAIEAVSGYTQRDFYDNPDMALELLPPQARHVIETLGTRPEELEGKAIVLPWRRKDGTTAWVEQRNVLVRDEAGRVVAFEGVARDISERKGLEDRYARLNQVVEQAAEVVLVTDLQGVIVYVNPAFERVTGFTAAEAIGQTPRLLKSGLQEESVYRKLWGALSRGESWTGRVLNRRKDGTIYVADVVISPVRDGTGAVASYVGLQRDVTRESELDEQLRQAQKMEAVGQLTGGIAHDFNNLLTIILANAALLDEHHQAGAAAPDPEYLPEIQAAARRGAELVRKLLAFTRQERLRPRSLDLGREVEEFRSSLGRMLPATIDLVTDLPPGVPRAMADSGAVEQILLNLATNARDAMPLGGQVDLRLGSVEFTAKGEPGVTKWRQPGRFVHLSFRDTGTGMTPMDLERIFDPFFTTKPPGKGSGLGMPMVYGLMKQHGGFVTVESAPGLGTTVHLYFPIAEEQGAGDDPARAPRAAEPPPTGGREVILLVEDEAPIRRVALRVLESLGYRVLSARDGVEALDVWREHQSAIDLILTDVVMPRLNGPGLVARIREEGGRVRVLFATGYASADVMTEHSLAAEDVHFIEKPWTLDQLAVGVREALRSADP